MTWYMIGVLLVGDAILYFISALNLKKMKSEERAYYEMRAAQQEYCMEKREEKVLEYRRSAEKYREKQDQFNREITQLLIDKVQAVEAIVNKKEKKK